MRALASAVVTLAGGITFAVSGGDQAGKVMGGLLIGVGTICFLIAFVKSFSDRSDKPA
jgi:hypothetical protein